MVAVFDTARSETDILEERALERMIGTLCDHVEYLMREAQQRGHLGSREAELQSAAYAERRDQAWQVLRAARTESHDIRIARLQRAADALDCSRCYFRGAV